MVSFIGLFFGLFYRALLQKREVALRMSASMHRHINFERVFVSFIGLFFGLFYRAFLQKRDVALCMSASMHRHIKFERDFVSFIGLFFGLFYRALLQKRPKRERLHCACLHPYIHKAVSDCGEQNALSFAKEPYKRALSFAKEPYKRALKALLCMYGCRHAQSCF